MKKYVVERNPKYDYTGLQCATVYPNLHRYPASMVPRIGIDILQEFGISSGSLLDPYCGSGTSFFCGLECGIKKMTGYDINPLAVMIAKAKFTKISVAAIDVAYQKLRDSVFEMMKSKTRLRKIQTPEITNVYFWFSDTVVKNLSVIKHCIDELEDDKIKNIFFVPFSETVRDCSYTRNNEFKLFRMKEEEIRNFNPDVTGYYFKKLDNTIQCYKSFYLPKLKKNTSIKIHSEPFQKDGSGYDLVLTSPPYGDSRTTVAYGQFSTLSNEWLGIKHARKIDSMLMGGKRVSNMIDDSCLVDSIQKIALADPKRALEVSSFYFDLKDSINTVAQNINPGGTVVYVVGNRTVKNIYLPTDQFIAETFEENGFKHVITYERAISNKAMPSRNSPTNEVGKTVNTMLYEYIVVCKNHE
jgi:16S rRNA G966 N2-methylase RsmD